MKKNYKYSIEILNVMFKQNPSHKKLQKALILVCKLLEMSRESSCRELLRVRFGEGFFYILAFISSVFGAFGVVFNVAAKTVSVTAISSKQ